MSLWGNLDASNNVPKQTDTVGNPGGNTPQVTSNGQVYYANTQIDAYAQETAVGIFGVSAGEQANTLASSNERQDDASSATNLSAKRGVPQHAGWVLRKVGTGPLLQVDANAHAQHMNTFVTLSDGSGIAGSGASQGNVQIKVNSTFAVTEVVVNDGGNYANTPTITINEGPIKTITANAGAVGVNSTLIIGQGGSGGVLGPGNGSGDHGNVRAQVSISVNATGYILPGFITITNPGLYASAPNVNANNQLIGGTSNAVFTVTLGDSNTVLTIPEPGGMGGRAGRTQTETLVAMGSMTGDTAAKNVYEG